MVDTTAKPHLNRLTELTINTLEGGSERVLAGAKDWKERDVAMEHRLHNNNPMEMDWNRYKSRAQTICQI